MNAWEHLPYAPLKPEPVRDGIMPNLRETRTELPSRAVIERDGQPIPRVLNTAYAMNKMYPFHSRNN